MHSSHGRAPATARRRSMFNAGEPRALNFLNKRAPPKLRVLVLISAPIIQCRQWETLWLRTASENGGDKERVLVRYRTMAWYGHSLRSCKWTTEATHSIHMPRMAAGPRQREDKSSHQLDSQQIPPGSKDWASVIIFNELGIWKSLCHF